jgi:hypothetical protein
MIGRLAVVVMALTLATDAIAEPVEIALQIGGTSYRYNGEANCRRAEGSVYEIRATQYSVSQRAGKDSLNMTLWRPKDGAPDMLVLNVSVGGKRHDIDTVKSRTKRDARGSAKLSFEPSGRGGTFRIEAVAGDGEKVAGTVKCAAFGAVRAEGG